MQLVVLSRTIDGVEPHDWVVLKASNTQQVPTALLPIRNFRGIPRVRP